MKIHRTCYTNGVPADCNGAQKIKTDYKDKLDSFQKIFFGKSLFEFLFIFCLIKETLCPLLKIKNL